MVVFVGLIIPLPYKIKRKLFTFISESPIVAKIQYGMKVGKQHSPAASNTLMGYACRSHLSSFSFSSLTVSIESIESKLSCQPIRRTVEEPRESRISLLLPYPSALSIRVSLIPLTFKSQSRCPRIRTHGSPSSKILFPTKHVPMWIYTIPIPHS